MAVAPTFFTNTFSANSQAPSKEGLKPSTMDPLVGITRHQLWPLGTINLPLTLINHEGKETTTKVIEFLVIRRPADDGMLLSRTALFQLLAIPSTIHKKGKFSTSIVSSIIFAFNPCTKCHQDIATLEKTHVP